MNQSRRFPFLGLIAITILLNTTVASDRWYDPHVGRFISRDLDEYADATEIDGHDFCVGCRDTPMDSPSPANVRWHKYRYCANAPLVYADVDGLSVISIIDPRQPIVWKCKRRLARGQEGCCGFGAPTRGIVGWAYPILGHCSLKIGLKDAGQGFYPTGEIKEESGTVFPFKWCRPTTADPDCVETEFAKPQNEYDNFGNNCCSVVNRTIRKCNLLPIF